MSEEQLKLDPIVNALVDDASALKKKLAHASCCLSNDGKSIYIFGGRCTTKSTSSSQVWQFDMKAKVYKQMKNLPVALSCTRALRTPDNKIAIIGGGTYCPEIEQKNDIHIYDEINNCYDTIHLDYDIGQSPYVCFDMDQNLHCIGGWTGQQQHLMINWKDKHVTVMSKPPFNSASGYSYCISNKIYVVGGKHFTDSKRITSQDVHIYGIKDDVWTKGAPIPARISSFASVKMEFDHLNTLIILFGGYDPDKKNISSDILMYNVKRNEWITSKRQLPNAIQRHCATTTNDMVIHSFGGLAGLWDSDYTHITDKHTIINVINTNMIEQMQQLHEANDQLNTLINKNINCLKENKTEERNTVDEELKEDIKSNKEIDEINEFNTYVNVVKKSITGYNNNLKKINKIKNMNENKNDEKEEKKEKISTIEVLIKLENKIKPLCEEHEIGLKALPKSAADLLVKTQPIKVNCEFACYKCIY